MNRRGFLAGLGAALAAPAIVKAEILMPIRGIIMPPPKSLVISPASTTGLRAGDSIYLTYSAALSVWVVDSVEPHSFTVREI